ncbi:putative uncharacterized protein DDB_G0286901 [Ostrinia furnacalis]|uniref:putative uncharacterized protein DDB_G0286901 n=1 Tax=Ostrinia furnacalis TaxID=93504 RepID=UPI00103EF77E|nr:putative uncharacterized protein DDB_G0286901 [Ostrinia furnacalis]
MADSFFGFDTSLSNLNDDEGAGEPSEDEYDALNDETFGQDSEEFDWEVQHENLALLDRGRHHGGIDDAANSQLEASLSQLVLDETDAPQPRTLGSNVWRHDGIPKPITPVQSLKNVCTVEELERQLRQKQPQPISNQNFFQPRFQPVILQRPPGLQAPVPLPFAPQQQMNQPLNKIIGQPNQMQNHLGQNMSQMGQNLNQMGQNMNQMSQNVNQFMQSSNQMFQNSMGQGNLMNMSQNMQGMQPNHMMQNQMGQNQMTANGPFSQMGQINQSSNMQMNQGMGQMGQNLQMGQQPMNQMGQNAAQLGQNMNMGQLGQNMNQMGQNLNHMGQNFNQMGPNINALGQQMNQNLSQMGQNMNQMGPNVNQMNQNVNQMGQNMSQTGQNANQTGQNQMIPNGNQFGGPGMGQYPHMMGQPRMMAPPGINMPRQNFSPNMAPFNNFRAPSIQSKSNEPVNHNIMNQPILNKNTSPQKPLANSSPQTKTVKKEQPKVQKSRVYNNSKTVPQNLTSQNLVQLIQNTHPMLQQMSTSYHNASHHPMLNNRNMFGNNQFMNNQVFNQRQNGSFSNNMHQTNGEDGKPISTVDEYAGLMTQREKQWLINIQMLQLNTGTPYIHDFYYTVFLERQASKEKDSVKEAHKANQQNHPFYSGGSNSVKQENHPHGRERHNSNRHNSTSEDAPTPRTYVPTQFENSLGKLQCGSVTAPRKIIDVELVGAEPSRASSRAPSRASTTNPNEIRVSQSTAHPENLFFI